MTAQIRALIVDDEPLARARLRKLLAGDGDVAVIGECGNGREAVTMIREQEPDLLFLDIEMPELDGFGVVREVGAEEMPVVVFTTAHDEYALRAFEVYALDYLLKPVDRGRFAETLERAKGQIRRDISAGNASERLLAWLEHLSARQRQTERLAIKIEGRVVFVNTADIDWIEAMDNHMCLHMGNTTHLTRDTMAHFEERLPATSFLRVHRSAIVNVQRIREIQPWFGGDFMVILTDGTQLTSGRSYRQRVRGFLEQSI